MRGPVNLIWQGFFDFSLWTDFITFVHTFNIILTTFVLKKRYLCIVIIINNYIIMKRYIKTKSEVTVISADVRRCRVVAKV